jgi:hypothetical protein
MVSCHAEETTLSRYTPGIPGRITKALHGYLLITLIDSASRYIHFYGRKRQQSRAEMALDLTASQSANCTPGSCH